MNKHLVIRTLSIVFVLATVYTISLADVEWIHANAPANLSTQQFDWHADMASEVEWQSFHLEDEIVLCTEMKNELVELEPAPVFIPEGEILDISPIIIQLNRRSSSKFLDE